MILLPKRRWLRFSVRTLLVAVTIFCMWLGWQVQIVRHRHVMLQLAIEGEGGFTWFDGDYDSYGPSEIQEVSWIRKLLGDKTAVYVNVGPFTELTDEQRQQVLNAFPERLDASYFPIRPTN